MTRGNQRDIDRQRAAARAKATEGSTKKTSKDDDAAAMRAKQAAANKRAEEKVLADAAAKMKR